MRNSLRLATAILVVLTYPQTAAADLTSGLVAFFPFTGNANDASGHGNHGTVNGPTLTTDRFGNPNSAYHFGEFDFIEVSASPTLDIQGSITLSAWTLMESTQSCQTIFDKDSYRLKGWGGNPVGYALELYMPQQAYASANVPRPIGVWTHVAGTWDGTTLSIYQDGALMSTSTSTGSLSLTGSNLFIGKQSYLPNPACWFFGALDELRIYNRALTAGEIQDLFHELEPTCTMGVTYANGTLTVAFDLATKEAVQWNVWVSNESSMVRLWSVALPIVDPTVHVAVPFPGVPRLGSIGFLTTFVTPARGIRCSSWKTIDTGNP